ncbi:hypothetical protein L1987_78678 [Smallanthus sonchifolius]|uniref:Uncharacterized protein n=1 Tax=Smallanthus sonchifolius TaxID=185202 RepID=A0ACB8ZEC3_9ASTR|nr:hypothetical protein L1987_78678 [Smallanthus sonchifolius]
MFDSLSHLRRLDAVSEVCSLKLMDYVRNQFEDLVLVVQLESCFFLVKLLLTLLCMPDRCSQALKWARGIALTVKYLHD